jgi:hypothetical protein
MLIRPDCCAQHLMVDFSNLEPDENVSTFRCGVCPTTCCVTGEAEVFDVMSNGTIAPRAGGGLLVLGIELAHSSKLKLVPCGDSRQLVFKNLQSATTVAPAPAGQFMDRGGGQQQQAQVMGQVRNPPGVIMAVPVLCSVLGHRATCFALSLALMCALSL